MSKPIEMCPVVPALDAETFARFMAGEMPHKEHQVYAKAVTTRCNYVVWHLHELYDLVLDWWDFDNLDRDGDEDGVFDINAYADEVSFVGQIKRVAKTDSKDVEWLNQIDGVLPVVWNQDGAFPTSYLTSDFDDIERLRIDAWKQRYQESTTREELVKKQYAAHQKNAMAKMQAFWASLPIEERATLSLNGEPSKFVSAEQYERRVKNLKQKELAAQHKNKK